MNCTYTRFMYEDIYTHKCTVHTTEHMNCAYTRFMYKDIYTHKCTVHTTNI